MAYNIGILGATGAVGQEIIRLLHERKFPIGELRLLASARSAGKTQSYGDQTWTIQEATPDSFAGLDVCIFSAGADQSKLFAQEAVKRGCLVIDNSSAFRMEDAVPLVVPEINPEAAFKHQGIIANPNCSTIITLMGLYPLHQAFGLKSIVASTYQAVSGSGAGGIVELEQQARAWAEGGEMVKKVYPHQIAFNLIPHVDKFLDDGYTKEEMKMLNEGRKIMGMSALKVSCTCVRVPVFRAHCISVSADFERPVSVAAAREAIAGFAGVELVDDTANLKYPMPLDYSEVVNCGVGRIRKDQVFENGLALWVTGDQVWKGAALNAIQIAELLHEKGRL
ncbi:MAG: aspartate-semialdehyde dehydrogenase [Puniceicoccaceae bacterium]|nr:MAG: aspartate-semialdehyde dehydrogenase [Puniceicoccaceae bacterium]